MKNAGGSCCQRSLQKFKEGIRSMVSEQIKTTHKATQVPSFSRPPVPAAGSLDSSDQDGSEDVATGLIAGERLNAEGLDSQGLRLPPIPRHIVKKIKRYEYVSFDYLLPPSLSGSKSLNTFPMNDMGEYDIRVKDVDGNPTISLSQKTSGRGKVKDFNTWTLAWSHYFRCYYVLSSLSTPAMYLPSTHCPVFMPI